jgi:hypothetical protein
VPWSAKDALRHTKKATSPKLVRQWLHIANGELKAHGDEKRAIMAANGVLAREAAAGRPRRKKR